MATIIDTALTILTVLLVVALGIPLVVSVTVIAIMALIKVVQWVAFKLSDPPQEEPSYLTYEEHEKVLYQGMVADLVWFNPVEREWMLLAEDGKFYFADEKELTKL